MVGCFFMTQPKTVLLRRSVVMANELIAECPECAADVALPADAVEGEIVQCPECGIELEVVNLAPLTLEMAPEEEEDWGE
jgi:alpha-aminoadipate carrier protein LysW